MNFNTNEIGTRIPACSTQQKKNTLNCKVCGLPGAEVTLNPCGCSFHSRCFPTSFFFDETTGVTVNSQHNCPTCDCKERKTVYLEPLDLDEIQPYYLAGETENFFLSLAPIFLIQSSEGSEIIVDEDIQIRNGRWTSEEVAFIDFLIKTFREGKLPVPNGISLNNFLRSIFLCKGTRLRKKIKNANFCTRLYKISTRIQQCDENPDLISKLQNDFIRSIEAEDDRYLFTFSMKRMWSTHFFNFCVQIGFDSIDPKDWLDSIESIEKQVVAAKESKKKRERRYRVDNFVLKTERPDPPEYHGNVVDSGIKWNNNEDFKHSENPGPCFPSTMVPLEIREQLDDFDTMSEVSFGQSLSSSFEHSNDDSPQSKRIRTDKKIDDALILPPDDDDDVSLLAQKMGDWSPFVRKVSTFIKNENMPFQYFDVWFASSQETSNIGNQSEQNTVLYHVGHNARDDIDSIWNLYHMNQFGKYSSTFTFEPGVGLPGRVFESGSPTWDDSLQNTRFKNFPRMSGARSHGVKIGLGIPMFHTSLGQIVVAMYSCDVLTKDVSIVQKCCDHFQLANPNPKWEVVLDTGGIEKGKSVLQDNFPDEEEAIANLLSRHATVQSSSTDGFLSLRLLLLQAPHRRADFDNSNIEMLKASYRNYSNTNKRGEEIAQFLVREWEIMRESSMCFVPK